MAVERSRCYKVSEITKCIKDYLEGEFYSIQIEGEVSGFKPSSSGHFYFTLKDTGAAISAVLFARSAKNAGYLPKDGDLVIVTGYVTVYAKSGNYQIVCSYIEKAGQGDIFAELEKRKQRLASEGLFDEANKKPIPLYPKRIGVVTSPNGAAIRDILRVLKRRNNSIDLIILPAPVQGDEAAPIIASQIRRANMFKMCDVLLVSRGGGAPEDLLPFSDEEVVRAVAASQIPTISAVGHEIDVVLTDFAADLRAPTPSAAAEVVSREADNVLGRILDCSQSIRKEMLDRLDRARLVLDNCSKDNLKRSMEGYLDDLHQNLDDQHEDLVRSAQDILKDNRHRLELVLEGLRASSPESILKRGYAAVYNISAESYAGSAASIKAGDRLDITFYDGKAAAVAEKQGE
ncbi:MAG: exodeoxyribonuclease VII large subunit [Spirochaetia bacterium]|nr:exodeoxyribonuclease VII large subunit [Spirochaetia bacterium]MBQ3713578.1 exodeoxyribonuclease VII large subunit [Spirochaetia bacterium]MBR0318704.1 exodeoxyribonuclease VII large subunit [Spirochaetia bacterium]